MKLIKQTKTGLLLLLVITLISCSDSASKKDKHYKRALEYIKLNNTKAAVIELKNAIQIDAKFADARYQLGLIYLKDGNPQAAFGELQRTYSLDPKNLDAGVKVAEFYLLSQNKDESRKYAVQVLATNDKYIDGLSLLANLDLIEGKYDKAEATVEKALAEQPANDKLLNLKARIKQAQGKTGEAIQLLEKAIGIDPDNFNNYKTLLLIYERQKNDDAIQKLLGVMTPRFPDNPQLYLMLSDLYIKRGELDKAEQQVLKAVEMKKNVVQYRLLLADFYKKFSQFDKAEQTLTKALADFKNDIQLQVALGDTLFELRKFDEAKTIMEKILKTNPTNGGANLLHARFLIKEGKNQEALELLTPLISDYPKWAEPYYYGALCHLRVGNLELAQKLIEVAVRNSAGSDRFHALAAQINLMRGNSKESTQEAVAALRLNPRNIMAIRILAKALIQAKEFDKAISLIEKIDSKAVERDPELLDSLGMGYLGAKNREKARQIYDKLLQLTPKNANVLAMLTALTTGDDLNASIEFVKKHMEAHSSADGQLLLGELYIKNKQFEDALVSFDSAKKLEPDNPRPYLYSGSLLKQLGRNEETLVQFEKLLEKEPKSVPGLMGLASVYEITGKTGEAMAKYKKILELSPDQPLAANNLAWMIASQENGDLGEALRLAMLAKQSLPDMPSIADTLGWVHYKRKSYPLAIAQFQQALEKQPNHPVIRYHLALAQYANGDKKTAQKTLREALAGKTPNDQRPEMEKQLRVWEAEQK